MADKLIIDIATGATRSEPLTPAEATERAALATAAETARSAEAAKVAKAQAVDAAVATMRQWASDARGTTVTSGNAVATLQVVVARLGTFFDRFADLVESQR